MDKNSRLPIIEASRRTSYNQTLDFVAGLAAHNKIIEDYSMIRSGMFRLLLLLALPVGRGLAEDLRRRGHVDPA
ncbi:MAG: hypothetical protein OXH27_08460, partial [Gammaproteobacteria bacterium]|nr:hypothetical protein [Gammaproteobacteria bacterium]